MYNLIVHGLLTLKTKANIYKCLKWLMLYIIQGKLFSKKRIPQPAIFLWASNSRLARECCTHEYSWS